MPVGCVSTITERLCNSNEFIVRVNIETNIRKMFVSSSSLKLKPAIGVVTFIIELIRDIAV